MRSIVFSTVSHLDMYTGEDRKDRWRPLLELLRIHDFKVDRLYFFISHLYRHIPHRKGTMEAADILYGVTMQEKGVSKLVSVKFDEDYNLDKEA